MKEMLSLEKFLDIKSQMRNIVDNSDINENNADDYFNLQRKLLSYDLSLIPATEWQDIELFPYNIINFYENDDIKPDVIDLSGTNANIDFSYFDVDDYNYNFHNCNISNLELIGYFNPNWFDQRILDENKDILLSDNFSDKLKQKIYNREMTIDDVISLPNELLDEIYCKSFIKDFIVYSADYGIIDRYLGFFIATEMYKNHREDVKNISTILFEDSYNDYKNTKMFIKKYDDINSKIEYLYDNLTDIGEIICLNNLYPIRNYNVDLNALKPNIINYLKNTNNISSVNKLYNLEINLTDEEKHQIIKYIIDNNERWFDYDLYKVFNIEEYLNEREIKQILKESLSNLDIYSISENIEKINENISFKKYYDESMDAESIRIVNYLIKENMLYSLFILDSFMPISSLLKKVDKSLLKNTIALCLKNGKYDDIEKFNKLLNIEDIIKSIDDEIIKEGIANSLKEENSYFLNYLSEIKNLFAKDINEYINQQQVQELVLEIQNKMLNDDFNSYMLVFLKENKIEYEKFLSVDKVKQIVKTYYKQHGLNYEFSIYFDFVINNPQKYYDEEWIKHIIKYNPDNIPKLFNGDYSYYVDDDIKNYWFREIEQGYFYYLKYIDSKLFSSEQLNNLLIENYNNEKYRNCFLLAKYVEYDTNFLKQYFKPLYLQLFSGKDINFNPNEYKSNIQFDNLFEEEEIESLITKYFSFDDKYLYLYRMNKYYDITNRLDEKSRRIIEIANECYSEEFLKFFSKQNIDDINKDKIEDYRKMMKKIKLSNSSEIQHLGDTLIKQLLKLDNPTKKYNEIENIFLKNHIPYVGKAFSVFQILRDYKIESAYSQVLAKQNNFERQVTLFSDILKCSVKSGNRDLKEYIDNIEKGNELFLLIASNKINYEQLSNERREIIDKYITQLYVLYENTVKGKKEPIKLKSNIDDNINQLIRAFSSNGKFDYNLPDRVVRMFGHFAGYDTLDSIKEDMENSIVEANQKGIDNSKKKIKLEDGDFIKGINDLKYLGNILQNGSIAADFLGDNAESDNTPLDTDISMIIGNYDDINDAVANTVTGGDYGDIILVLKKDDKRFNITKIHDNRNIDAKNDSRLEVFYSGFLGNSHYGIRGGFPSSEIDYILVREYNNRIGFEIARNGFYIPVVNRDGELVFTIDDYNELRKKMEGLSHYSTSKFELSNNLENEMTSHIESQLVNNEENTSKKRMKVVDAVRRAMDRLDLEVHTELSKDISEGFVELIDTGSTGRGTNVPNDGDFDFMMKVDKKIISNFESLEQLKKEIQKEFISIKEKDNVNGNFRYKGVEIEGLEEPVDIDITFVVKTNKVTYSTDMCVKDRLESIKKQHSDKYDSVIANIITAKEILKKFEVYKNKNNHDNPQGGLGGVGVENWILQHGGSFEEAAIDFISKSNDKSFEDFQKIYPIWDFGENHMALDKDHTYLYDDYIYNMSSDGYSKMKDALNYYLKSIKTNGNVEINEVNKQI